MPGHQMSPIKASMKKDSRRAWISGLLITLTVLVALFGFWRLSPGATFIIACLALVAFAIAFWMAGEPRN